MSESFDLKEELRQAAIMCGLADVGNKSLPPIVFHYIAQDSGRKGHLSTPWVLSLCPSGKMLSAEEAAVRITATHSNWEAENGYINITLTQAQIDNVINELAAAFESCKYDFVRPDDDSENFMMEYFIYLAAQQERIKTAQGSDPCAVKNNGCANPNTIFPAIVYASLGGNCRILEQEMYCYYKKNYYMETTLHYGTPWLQAAAEIFARRLYKIKYTGNTYLCKA